VEDNVPMDIDAGDKIEMNSNPIKVANKIRLENNWILMQIEHENFSILI
jgi:hypothetical protein